jgi:hypothetical protein
MLITCVNDFQSIFISDNFFHVKIFFSFIKETLDSEYWLLSESCKEAAYFFEYFFYVVHSESKDIRSREL